MRPVFGSLSRWDNYLIFYNFLINSYNVSFIFSISPDVESESNDNTYYFVKYQPSVLEGCSCRDNSTRRSKCKHIWSVYFAIKFGTLKDTDKLPEDAKRDTSSVLLSSIEPEQIAPIGEAKSYTEDEHSFWFLRRDELNDGK